jgi:uncharacterized protein YgiM (DUF1202 family)
MKYLGYPYTATGNSPATGFSCIGFVSYVYRQNGIPLPGDLGHALAYAPQVSFSQLEPGDIMYFQNTVWNGLSHAAIYVGGGKFIHAEWYGKGVRITSFYNDATDGNYWPSHYMTANRPWTGAAVGSVIPTTPPSSGGNAPTAPTTKPGTAPNTAVPNGPASTVTAKSGLYLRSGPGKSYSPIQVLAPGTTVYVIGHSGTWDKVQLADGTVGWVDSKFVSNGSVGTGSSSNSDQTVSVGNPTAPSRIGKSTTKSSKAYLTVRTSALNVRSGPSTSAAVVGSVTRGQKLIILGYSNGWYKVQLPNGTVGWVISSYVASHRPAHSSSVVRATGGTRVHYGHTASAALNVRSGPSLSSSIVAVIPVGGSYQILGWSNGWARVRLPNGAIGWVSGTVIGGSSSTTYKSRTSRTTRRAARRTASVSSRAFPHRLTAGVRIHAGASLSSRVIGLAGAGAHVAVLGYRNGFALIRLRSGTTGYVYGAYVR